MILKLEKIHNTIREEIKQNKQHYSYITIYKIRDTKLSNKFFLSI